MRFRSLTTYPKAAIRTAVICSSICLSSTVSTSAYGATDGVIDTEESTATFDVNLKIPEMIHLDVTIDFDDSTGTSKSRMSREAEACIYFNAGGSYSITAQTNSTNFKLNGRDNDKQLDFKAYWNDRHGKKGRKLLQHGVPLTGQTVNIEDTQECIKGTKSGNSNFSMDIDDKHTSDIKSGTFNTTISIIITPE